MKVQRPGALAAISLDVGIIRSFAEPWRRFKGLNTDLESLVDEWGRRFVEELDYTREAANSGERFRLGDGEPPGSGGRRDGGARDQRRVHAPRVDHRLDRRPKAGHVRGRGRPAFVRGGARVVPRDAPGHRASARRSAPGNLFRTADGKLCILDWGLVTPVSPELSTAILSFIAHLVSKDFERVPADLDAMGFIPAGKREAMEDAGVASAIGLLFGARRGGGARVHSARSWVCRTRTRSRRSARN